jgi:hypothetical protein
VDAAEALADLVEISSQVRAAVLLEPSGAVQGSIGVDEAGAHALARAAVDLAAAAATLRAGQPAVERIEARLRSGSLLVLREDGRLIAATTAPRPTSALVFYDLGVCLKAVAPAAGVQPEDRPAAARRRRRRKEPADDAA